MNIVNQLEQFVNSPIDPKLFPYKKDRKIFIGTVFVKEDKNSFLVKDKNGTVYGRMDNKITAVALAKTAKSKSINIQELFRLDRLITKYKIDSMFYKNALKNSNESEQKAVLDLKLQNASSRIAEIRKKLETIIFPKKLNIINYS